MTGFARIALLAIFLLALIGPASFSTRAMAEDFRPPLVTVLTNAVTLPVVPAPLAVTPAAPPPTRFATLEAAIAAQDGATADDATRAESLRCLATAVYFEAKGEPLAGQLAVAQVILNRIASHRYPADICSVVKQPGQFSFVHGGTLPIVDEGRAAWRTAASLAKVAMSGVWDGPVPQALFFHARRVGVAARHTLVAAIGNHLFYR